MPIFSAAGARGRLCERIDAAREDADDREGDREIREAAHAPLQLLGIAHRVEDVDVRLLVGLRIALSRTLMPCSRRWPGAIRRAPDRPTGRCPCQLFPGAAGGRRLPVRPPVFAVRAASSVTGSRLGRKSSTWRGQRDAERRHASGERVAEPVRPSGDLRRRPQKIVTHLDHHMQDAALAAIGGGSCSRHCRAPNKAGRRRPQGRDRRRARPASGRPRRRSPVWMMPTCQGRAMPRQTGVKECSVTRTVGRAAAMRAARRVSSAAWNGDQTASMRCRLSASPRPRLPGIAVSSRERRDRIRAMRIAVAVDDEARIGLQHRQRRRTGRRGCGQAARRRDPRRCGARRLPPAGRVSPSAARRGCRHARRRRRTDRRRRRRSRPAAARRRR